MGIELTWKNVTHLVHRKIIRIIRSIWFISELYQDIFFSKLRLPKKETHAIGKTPNSELFDIYGQIEIQLAIRKKIPTKLQHYVRISHLDYSEDYFTFCTKRKKKPTLERNWYSSITFMKWTGWPCASLHLWPAWNVAVYFAKFFSVKLIQ